MREIIISRPSRIECCAMTLRVEVNGKNLAKLKNGKRIIMNVDEGPHVIRIHGSFFANKRFQDTITIPEGRYSYSLQVDFVSDERSNSLPVLRPFAGFHEKDDNRVTTILGATLSKVLLEEKVRTALRKLPGARLKVMLLQREWRLLLWHDGGGQILLRSEYAGGVGDVASMLSTLIGWEQMKTQEGRDAVLDKVMNDYVGALPDYERDGKYGLVFKG